MGGKDNFHYIIWKTLIAHAKKLQENLLTTDWDKFSEHKTIKNLNISGEKQDLEVENKIACKRMEMLNVTC